MAGTPRLSVRVPPSLVEEGVRGEVHRPPTFQQEFVLLACMVTCELDMKVAHQAVAGKLAPLPS